MPGRRRRQDAGFTMIEVLVTTSLMTVLMTAAVSGWASWSRAHAHEGAAVDLQSTLRHAQQRAVTEGTSLCLRFEEAADSWRLEDGRCESVGGPLLGGPWSLDDPALDLVSPRFTGAGGTLVPGVTFSPRGTASPGSVTVTREDSDHRWTVHVEGLTGRAAIS